MGRADNTDKRVVEMQFDNSKFEKNAKRSMSTLDKLNEKLSMQGVSKAVGEVSLKFSAMQIAAVTAISTITNKVLYLGKTLIKSLSVDQITSGWTKYGQKVTAVATMTAQSLKVAGKEITNATEKTKVINDYLEKLNWFSDETSYSFTDMVDNVGKFTAAGQDLDKSVEAMQGIATWAALSGQNAAVASRAMYQLSQAMGKGKIQLIDYKSIQNANMDTQEFRQTILDAAVALGELTKQGEEYITKTGKKFKKNQFAEELDSGWFTSDVLVKGLQKYSSAVQQIYEISEKEGLTASQVIKKYGDSLDQFGVKAFKAAQEARTFTDVINATKDAVSTGWMNTFEKIFGQYKDARELWSNLADEFYDLFASSGELRNAVLDVWNSFNGKADLFKKGSSDQGAFWNIYDAILAVRDIIKDSWNTIFPKTQFSSMNDQAKEMGKNLKNFTSQLKEFTKRLIPTEETSEKLKRILEGIFSVLRLIITAVKGAIFAISPLVSYIKDLFGDILSGLSAIGGDRKFEKISNVIVVFSQTIAKALNYILYYINPKGLIIKAINFIRKAVTGIINFFKQNSGVFDNLKSIFKSFVGTLKNIGSIIISTISKVGPKLGELFAKVLQASVPLMEKLGYLISVLVKKISDLFSKVVDFLNKNNVIGKVVNGFTTAISKIPSLLSKIAPALNKIGDVGKSVISGIAKLPSALFGIFGGSKKNGSTTSSVENEATNTEASLSKSMKRIRGANKVVSETSKEISKTANPIVGFIKGITDKFSKIKDNIFRFNQTTGKTIVQVIASVAIISTAIVTIVLMLRKIHYITNLIKNISEVFDSLSGYLDAKAFQARAGVISGIVKEFALFVLSIAASLFIISKIDPDRLWQSVGALGIFVAILAAIIIYLEQANKITGDMNNSLKIGLKKGSGLSVDFNNYMKNFKALTDVSSLSIIISSISTAVIKIAIAAKILDKVSSTGIVGALGIMASIIFGSLLLVKMISENKIDSGDIKKIKVGIATMAGIIGLVKVLGKVAKELSNLPIKNVAVTIAMIDSFFLSIGLMLALLSATNEKGSGSVTDVLKNLAKPLLALSVALLSFGISMKMISDVPWQSIAVGVGSLVLMLGALVLLAKPASAFIPVIIALSSAVLILSSSILVAALGVKMFAEYLPELINVVNTNGEAMVQAMNTIGESIGSFLQGLLDGLSGTIMSFLMNMISTAIASFDNLLSVIDEHAPSIIEHIGGIISGVLTAIESNRELLMNTLVNLIVSAIEALVEKASIIVTGILKICVIIIKTVTEQLEPLVEELLNFLATLVKTVIDHIGPLLKSIAVGFLKLVGVILQLMNSMIGTLAADLVTFVSSLLLMAVQVISGMSNVMLKTFKMIIAKVVLAFGKAIRFFITDIPKYFSYLASVVWNALIDSLADEARKIPLVGDWMGDKISKLKTSVEDDIENNLNQMASSTAVKNAINSAADDIMDTMSSANDTIRSNTSKGIKEAFDAISDGLKDSIDDLGNQVQDPNISIGISADTSQADRAINRLGYHLGSLSAGNYAIETANQVSSAVASRNNSTYNGNNKKSKIYYGSGEESYGGSYSPVFNIYSTNPEDAADAVDRRLRINSVNARRSSGRF